jgi:hypothetical protein
LSERPELSERVWLFRRVGPGASTADGNRPSQIAFRLRPSRDERSLSFYDGSLVSAEQVLAGAPGEGWGVGRVPADVVRVLGFEVRPAPTSEPELGHVHVEAMPPVTEAGQIPAELRARLALQSTWAIPPER